MATTTASKSPIVTNSFLENSLSSPILGSNALLFTLESGLVYGVVCSFTFDSNIFTTYSPIQFNIIQEITSLTLKYALSAPEIAPTSAAAIIAASKHTYHGMPNFKPQYRQAPAPITYCPAAPMLNKPTFHANSTDSEHISNADAFTSVVPKYFFAAAALG